MNPTDEPKPGTSEPPDADDHQPLPLDPEGRESQDEVDEASDESFPASDPPSHSRSAATKD